MARVSRGLLGASAAASQRLKASTPDAAAESAIKRLRLAEPFSSVWKERVEWAQLYEHGNPDFYGRRVHSEEAIQDCRYVARVSRRARKGRLPPNSSEWGKLAKAIRRIYDELGESRQINRSASASLADVANEPRGVA